ncbi:MAG: hypothetical protein PUF87_06350 [Ruminococcus sp.]|nr:hypothetical protein [Ruminococcus sp.]
MEKKQKWEYKNITEICDIEKAIVGKIYKEGTCYVKLSAVDEFVGQINKPQEINNRFAVMEPIVPVNHKYLYIIICKAFPEFLHKYRTTINLQFETLKQLKVQYHSDREMQEKTVKLISTIDTEINSVKAEIEGIKKIKKWYTGKMFL